MEHLHKRIFQQASRRSWCGFHSPEGDKVECMVRLNIPTTNNKAMYETLIAGLDLTKVVGAANMVVYCDSQVVTSQVNDD